MAELATPAPATPPATIPLGQSPDLATFRQARSEGKTEIPNPAARVEPSTETPDPDVESDPELASAIDEIEKPAPEETPQQKAARTKRHKEAAIKSRITKLAKARDSEKTRADAAEQRARDLEARLNAGHQPAQPPQPAKAGDAAATGSDPEPKFKTWAAANPYSPEKYGADHPDPYGEWQAEFQEAKSAWRQRQADTAARETRQREQADQATTQRRTAHLQRVDAFKKTTPDYDEKVNAATVHVTPATERTTYELIDSLQESDHGPELEYHFASNPQEFARLQALPVRLAIYQLGQLEARLVAGRKPAPAAPPQIATPPAPHTPSGTGGSASTSFDPAKNNSVDDYRANRERLLARS